MILTVTLKLVKKCNSPLVSLKIVQFDSNIQLGLLDMSAS